MGVENKPQSGREEQPSPQFKLGQIVATPGAIQSLQIAELDPLNLLSRHVTGDWGDLVDEDKEANERALKEGSRVFSSYMLETGQKVWVITEWDRSVTTLLLPHEY